MEFNVSELLKLPVGSVRAYEVDEDVEGIEEPGSRNHVRGNVKMLRTKDGILVQANLNTEVGCTCSRCLEETMCRLQLGLEEEYSPTIDINTGYPLTVSDDPTDFTIDPNHVLSLDEAIRQYVLLNRPMQPLCKPDCAGLCPECGANLSLEKCDCHLRGTDNPLVDLGELLNNTDKLSADDERS